MSDSVSERLPVGWEVWNNEPGGQLTLTYRPDVFEGDRYPAPCIPTIVVTRNHPDRNPRSVPSGSWFVLCYLEPEVRVRERETSAPDRPTAIDAAIDLAEAFADGAVEYRSAYAVPRSRYLDRLDELTGRRDA